MSRPVQIFVLSCAVLLAACNGEAAETTTTSSTTSTTTTTTSTTTTTIPTTTTSAPLTIENAPEDLAAVITAFYDYAAARSDQAPPVPEPVLAAITPQEVPTPSTGVASVGVFRDQRVATVETGGDLFLLVDDGNGWRIVGGDWPSLGIPGHFGGAPRIVAVIGSDARPGEDIRATRADSIHLVGLDGMGGGGVIGVPRDSWITGPGGRTKITNILSNHGPEAFLETLRGLTGLPIEGWVLTGFGGFEQMVTHVLGGVTVNIPFPIRDTAARADLAAGVHMLDGAQALAFARARKTVPGGDFARSSHQGQILIASARKVQEMGYAAIPRLMEGSAPWVDVSLTPEQLLTFSAMAIRANLDAVPNVVAPGSVGRAGSASVVFLASSASNLFADLADGRLEQ